MDDLISREAAIKALCEQANQMMNWVEIYKQQRKGILTATNIIKDLPSAQPESHYDEWCVDCKEYDNERHCCPRWNKVIKQTLNDVRSEMKQSQWVIHIYRFGVNKYECNSCHMRCDVEYTFCPHCGAHMKKSGKELRVYEQ